VEGAVLRAGLYVRLVSQDRTVGVMVVHSTVKHAFTPGEVAMLQTFANQAAVAIQRAELVADLRAKIAQLEAAQVELAQKERMERELELARQVQQSVLPRTFPQLQGLRFAAWNEPARQVGGDLYDVIALDSNLVGIAIADVSDKGMPAALYMALTRSLLRAEARRARSPGDVLIGVNQLLLELGEPGLYVTIFYGIIDCTTHMLTYARAGHDRPLLLRAGSVEHLTGDGAALGLLDGSEFKLVEEQVYLLPGDRLVLFTDGMLDAQSPAQEMFGCERLRALLIALTGLAPDPFCRAVFASLADYRAGADPYDDMALLVMEVG
jgi:serine phosphatase RsbU (regulator of sigma subunit)